MIANTHYGYVKKAGKLQFTYTGTYNQREDGVVELLTSGTLVFLSKAVIDRFMVGGGSGGSSPKSNTQQLLWANRGCGGGAGGYTRTDKRITITSGTQIAITIGDGGSYGTETTDYIGQAGGTTRWNDISVDGGGVSGSINIGAPGGSGGGGGTVSNASGGTGGSNGNNGEAGSYEGGTGQVTTTREFGESDGKLYAGGGGGGRYISASSAVVSAGGAGGGGTGAWRGSYASGLYQAAAAGVANTGGGGGGGAQAGSDAGSYLPSKRSVGGSGGSGIICFRLTK